MKKSIFILFAGLLLAITAMSYYFKKRNKPGAAKYERQITVTGSTRNLNGCAAIVAPGTMVYNIEGLREWDSAWLGQEVQVTGDLVNIDDHPGLFGNSIDKARIIKAAVILLLTEGVTSGD